MFVGRDFDSGVAALNNRPMRQSLPALSDRPIAYKFGIKAAIVGEVDLLGHQAIQHWAHLCSWLVHMNGE